MRFPAVFLFAFCILSLTLFGAASFCRAQAQPVQDIFVGNGTPGPFALRWNTVEAGTESVSVNKEVQVRGLDYIWDAAAGTVTFTHSQPVGAAIEIAYALVPGQSQRSGSGQTIPVSLSLLRSGNSDCSLDLLGRQATGAQSALSLGIGLGWHGGQNDMVLSRFVYTPPAASGQAADTPGNRAGQPSDRIGLALSGAAGAGHWGRFSVSFSRAGEGLDTAGLGSSQFQAGRQALTLGGTLSPVKTVQAQFSFTRSEALADSDTAGAAQTMAVSLAAQATQTLQISAALNNQNLPGTAADRQTINLKTVLTPSRSYSMQASAEQSRRGAATTDQQSVTMTLSPQSAVKLNAGFLMRQQSVAGTSDTLGTTEATVGGTLRPLPILELSGSYKSRVTAAADGASGDPDTSTATVAFSPFKTIKMTGTYAQNPDDGAGTLLRLARRGIGLQTSLGAFGLSGGCDWSRAYGTPDVEETIHAAVGLRFSAATLLSVGYQTQQNLLDPTVPPATAYTVGFTHILSDRFSLSLSGKRNQAADTTSPDYNATASLGLKF